MADPATPIVLLADIGGTNSRFALAGSNGRPTRMLIIETFEPGQRPSHRPSAPVIVIAMNTS